MTGSRQQIVDRRFAIAIAATDLRLKGIDALVQLTPHRRHLDFETPDPFEQFAQGPFVERVDASEVAGRSSYIKTLNEEQRDFTRVIDCDRTAARHSSTRPCGQNVREIEQDLIGGSDALTTSPLVHLMPDDVKPTLSNPPGHRNVVLDVRTLHSEISELGEWSSGEPIKGVGGEDTLQWFDHGLPG
ncbi:MAG: hypothetical protein ACI8TP_004626 [Acidimicrobiales bacterium]|jgi:hypothetical protein